MQVPSFLIATLFILAFAITALSLWLSLRVFGLKTGSNNTRKIVGLSTAFFALISFFVSLLDGNLGVLFGLLSLLGGMALWVALLKHFAGSQYSLSKAVGSYIVGGILALLSSLMIAVLGISFFAQIYQIDGDSMAPAMKANQRVLVYKFNKQPGNNSLIIYRNSKGTQSLGRVRGTPGQSVVIPDGRVEVNGNLQEAGLFTLADTHYYVTVDNAAYNLPPQIIEKDSIVGIVGPKL